MPVPSRNPSHESNASESAPRPLTKIIATLGPATSTVEAITRLLEAGVSVFRLNFSHGDLADHDRLLATVREATVASERPAAVLGDLPGPKLRVGPVIAGGVDLANGSLVVLQREDVIGGSVSNGAIPRFCTTYDAFIDDVEPGQRVLIDDGRVRMLAVEKTEADVTCTVTHGGRVTTGKGINLPDTDVSAPSISERDWGWLKWAVEHDLDFVALSFVRTAADVRTLADGIRRLGVERGNETLRLPIVAKIEVPKALDDIDSIVTEADAIMVARGDLGVEMDLARVPVIQKQLIRICRAYGKPCIVATQMLESMIDGRAPTRAEANDVATAIFDEVDAVMLSGETAVGAYPTLAVEHMRRIAEHAEAYLAAQPARSSAPQKLVESGYHTAALAHGAWTVARDIGAKVVVVWSQTGGGARYLSQNNFHVPIIAATSDERAARQMQLLRGVMPVLMPVPDGGVPAFTAAMDEWLKRRGRCADGDVCLVVAGEPLGVARVTNTVAVHVVGT